MIFSSGYELCATPFGIAYVKPLPLKGIKPNDDAWQAGTATHPCSSTNAQKASLHDIGASAAILDSVVTAKV